MVEVLQIYACGLGLSVGHLLLRSGVTGTSTRINSSMDYGMINKLKGKSSNMVHHYKAFLEHLSHFRRRC
jgi:hypothetical protein